MTYERDYDLDEVVTFAHGIGPERRYLLNKRERHLVNEEPLECEEEDTMGL